MTSPEASQILAPIMKKASASRGEVAESASENKVLQKMMAAMSLESLLKKAGENVVSTDAVKAINDALQKIRKS